MKLSRHTDLRTLIVAVLMCSWITVEMENILSLSFDTNILPTLFPNTAQEYSAWFFLLAYQHSTFLCLKTDTVEFLVHFVDFFLDLLFNTGYWLLRYLFLLYYFSISTTVRFIFTVTIYYYCYYLFVCFPSCWVFLFTTALQNLL